MKFLSKKRCDACGKKIRGLINPIEISINKSKQLGMNQDKIDELVKDNIKVTKNLLLHEPVWVRNTIRSVNQKYGPLFPILCTKCKKRLS
jgi:hypothetical protein